MSADAAVVIGSGADELACAHQLARAGYRVTALEQHVAPDPQEGFLSPAIVRALDLDRRPLPPGVDLETDEPDPWITLPLPAGGRLALWRDTARSAQEIQRLSRADASRWPAFCAHMDKLAQLLTMLYEGPPPDPLDLGARGLMRAAGIGWRAHRLGRQIIEEFLRVVPMPVADLLDEWFESEPLKAAIAACAVRHLRHGPRSAGTAFTLLHHHVGCAPGVFRPRHSNLGRVLGALPGIEIRKDARVDRITTRAGCVTGVVLASGETLAAPLVVSGVDPRRTFMHLLGPAGVAPTLGRAVRCIRSRGTAARILFTLPHPVRWDPLVIAPSLDYLERAHDDAKYRRVSREPWCEARAARPAPDGRMRIEVHLQYAPYGLDEGEWDEPRRHALGTLAADILAPHVPELADAATDRLAQSPRDLEAERGWPEGQPYYAELALDQTLWMRPVPSLAHYHTPVAGLFLCGPGTHPGGAIAGASGLNAARAILRMPQRQAGKTTESEY